MYQYEELKKFLDSASNDGVDFEKVLEELKLLIYYTAKNKGKKLNSDQADEAVGQFIADLLSLNRPIINGFGYCLSHAVRLVYWVTDTRVGQVPLDEEVSLISAVDPSWEISDDFTSDFLNIFDSYLIHPELIQYFKSLKSYNPDFLLHLVKSDNFLGVLLKVAYLRYKYMLPMSRVVDVGNLNTREEEVLFGCVLTKINKNWTLSQYILMREIFLISLMTFVDPLITSGDSLYKKSNKSKILKNLLLSVKVYCYYEKNCGELGPEGTIKACGHRFNMCVRFVQQRINRVEKMLGRYDRIVVQRIRQFKRTVDICGREFAELPE
jgi:hypothetical protein